jgi:hypothetical protein
MFHDVPVVWQYAILAMAALMLTVVGLYLYNRVEKRRKHAVELMKLMNQWGLSWFADLFEDYAVGDYSGIVHKVREIVRAVRSDEAIVAKLTEVTKKVVTHVAANDATRAQELLDILNQGKAVQDAAAKVRAAVVAASQSAASGTPTAS